MAEDLWRLACVSQSPNSISAASPRLVVPSYADGGIRISEQEARFLFASAIEKTGRYFYTIETPTKEKYRFKPRTQDKNTFISARSDMSIWKWDKQFILMANIELKAHNVQKAHVGKDIEKLIRENITGNWFHLLRNADRGTFRSLFEKLTESFMQNARYVKEIPEGKRHRILFFFCVKDKKFSIYKVLTLHNAYDIETGIKDFFALDDYCELEKEPPDPSNDWKIFRYHAQ